MNDQPSLAESLSRLAAPQLFQLKKGKMRLTILPHSADRRLESLLDLGEDLRSSDGSRSVGSHATSVGSDVSISDPLVVLGSRKGSDGVAVRKGEDRELGSGEELLDDNLSTCGKEITSRKEGGR